MVEAKPGDGKTEMRLPARLRDHDNWETMERKNLSARCPCCEGEKWVSLGSKRGRHLVQDYEYLRCTRCGFTRVEPFAGFGIYDEAYYEGRGADPYVNYASEYRDIGQTDRLRELADFRRIVADHYAGRSESGPIVWLDYGCGAGGLLKYLRGQGGLVTAGGLRQLEIAGHDVGSFADRLRRDDGIVIHGEAELARLPDASFDVISLIEVIEHIPDPRPVMATCARLLRPGGLLLLTTGNFDCAVARRQGIDYRYCIPEIHVSLFSPASLAALYRRHGLEPVAVRYVGAVQFKILKSVPARWRGLARLALRLPGITRVVDRFYGVSRMPCACRTFRG